MVTVEVVLCHWHRDGRPFPPQNQSPTALVAVLSISLQVTRVILPKKYGFFRRIFYRNNMGRHRNICEDGKVSSQIGGQNAEYFPIFHFRPVLGVKTEVF